MAVDEDVMGSGTVKISVVPAASAAFRVALRVPSWASEFTVTLENGNMLKGKTGQFVNIDKTWEGPETIRVSMNIRDQVFEGSPTYKKYYAYKHGPYILALDQELNTVDIDAVKLEDPDSIKMTESTNALPEDWMGELAFTISSSEGVPVVLVPFLDAGQNGSRYRVWIPEIKNR